MSLSKTSGKQAVSKSSRVVHVAGHVKGENGNAHVSIAAVDNPATKVTALMDANSTVLTVNPKLDKVASEEKLNAKAESAKQMFSNYRNK